MRRTSPWNTCCLPSMAQLPNSHRQPGTETDHLDVGVNFTLGPSTPTDIHKLLEDIDNSLAYVDIVLTELWLFVLQNTPTPVNGQPIPPESADSLVNIEEQCFWLPKGGGSPCGHQVSSRKELVAHLNVSHGVNGSAKLKIPCRWLLDANNLTVCGREVRRANFSRHIDTHIRTTFPCPHPGCAKCYCRLDVLRKHLKTHSS
ncbi:hypothetical protein PISMIDRAFT_324425 [Pisolithus microcarpus 441]|uniref:Unplaced genomic scaffold scaffold_21, whole genome shotgun sequence n=1 Tax=Pisolithus microcarpus 441 TaxID=765257 RepID=A0A0C9ZU62_9AGAM|nr:hypothetical protein PISMIDRAFT_324425 [Pisolithus microcarpus 441]